MPITVLTDSEKSIRPKAIRDRFRFWLEFTIPIHRTHAFRRWFETAAARNTYIVDKPPNVTITETGEEPPCSTT